MTRRRAKTKLLPPYLVWRDGRPRWEPGPRLRAGGHKGRDLKDGAGQWLSLETAIAAARHINIDIAEAKRTGTAPKPQPKARKPGRTCRALYELWCAPHAPDQASRAWRDLARSTQTDYRSKARLFLDEFGDLPVAALRKSDLFNWWEELERERGLHMANGVIAVARTLLSYGEKKGWITHNPALKLSLSQPDPRVVVHTDAEIDAQLAAADALGLYGVGDAIMLALHTGQRRGDVLALCHDRTADGRCHFRISKTSARVSVPFTPALRERLDIITARRRQGTTPELAPLGALVRRRDGQPYTGRDFWEDYANVRATAAKTLPELSGKTFADLRDTAITRLVNAECTVAEITSITGHKLQSVHQVLEHYVARSKDMADAAIAKYVAYMEREGIRA